MSPSLVDDAIHCERDGATEPAKVEVVAWRPTVGDAPPFPWCYATRRQHRSPLTGACRGERCSVR